METKLMTDQNTHCYHCGNPCADTPITSDDKKFCCAGCQTVWEILNSNDLSDYYSLENRAGIRPNTPNIQDKYVYLDNPEIASKLLNFRENGISVVTFFMPQIHCSSCIWLLENLYKLSKNIVSSRVNFFKKEVKITFQSDTFSLRNLVELLVTIGYEPRITLEDMEGAKNKHKKSDNQLITKLGVTGFCFGNIMLLSFPEYLSIADLATEYKTIFGFLNIALSLPVIFFGATDYLNSAYKTLRSQQVNIDVPISLGIMTLFLVSIFDILTESGAGYMDSLAGLLFFLLIGRFFQSKTYQTLSFDRDYKSYFPISVTRVRDGNEEAIPVKSVEVGDRLLIRNQELIPVDAVLMSGAGQIDYSFVTGESDLIDKTAGDNLFAGGRQMGQRLEIEVIKPFSQGYLTSLWNDAAFKNEDKNQLTTLVDKMSKYFTLAVILIAILSLAAHLLLATGVGIKAFTSVLIIACPCALALATPFTFSSVLRVAGLNKLFLKNTEVVERMSKIDTLIFDKTGTLTQADKASVFYEGKCLDEAEKQMLKTLVGNSTHTLSRQIYESDYLKNIPKNHLQVSDFEEYTGRGVSAKVNKRLIEIGKLSFIAPGHGEPQSKRGANVFISIDGEYRGKFILKNHYRTGIRDVIEKLRQAFDLYVLSGDNEKEKPFLTTIFGDSSKLIFNCSPHDKPAFARKLKSQGKNVMMIGDGLNDAGSLRESNVGIALTDDITAFVPAGDGILHGSKLTDIEKFIRLSKAAVRIIRLGFVVSLSYNIIGLSFAVQGNLSPVISAILMPLSSISIIIFTTTAVVIASKMIGLKV